MKSTFISVLLFNNGKEVIFAPLKAECKATSNCSNERARDQTKDFLTLTNELQKWFTI